MKLHELKTKWSLNEMFNTKMNIRWTSKGHTNNGPFELNGHHYTIQVDEYTVKLSKSSFDILDIGFTSGIEPYPTKQTILATGFNKNVAKIFGILNNAVTMWAKKLNPDGLMFGARYNSGEFESRMRVYQEIAKWYIRGSSFKHIYGSFKTPQAEYFLLSKSELTKEDIRILHEFAMSIPEKP